MPSSHLGSGTYVKACWGWGWGAERKALRTKSGGWLSRKQCFPYTAGQVHIGNSQRLWEHAEDVHKLKAEKFQRLEEKVLPLAKKLFMVDSFWGNSSMKYHWIYPPDFRAGPMSRSSWSAQIKLHFFFLVCWKRERIWSLLGREDGRVWKELGKEKEYNKNILKFLKSK